MAEVAAYDEPYLPEFDAKSFAKEVVRERTACADLLKRIPEEQRSANELWTLIRCPRSKEEYRRNHVHWQPKLYVCVGKTHYFPTVRRFIDLFAEGSTRWKFYNFEPTKWPAGYGRPDKIVFYPRRPDEVPGLVRQLRRAIKGASFKSIRHAGRIHDGIWVGCDPMFLKEGVSWRVYRTLVNAFAQKNLDYLSSLPGGFERWLERMNLSSHHEGPASLSPPPKDLAYIRRYWSFIWNVE